MLHIHTQTASTPFLCLIDYLFIYSVTLDKISLPAEFTSYLCNHVKDGMVREACYMLYFKAYCSSCVDLIVNFFFLCFRDRSFDDLIIYLFLYG